MSETSARAKTFSLPTRDQMIEIGSAVVLSVAGLLTTWSGYQSALWDGHQAASYAQAGVLRITAGREAMEADTRAAVSVQLFTSWANAATAGDEALAEFYRSRMPPEFRPSFEKWLALDPLENPDAPSSPFALPGYEPQGRAKQRQLEAAADAAFAEGERANGVSDAFARGTVSMGTAMFFAGISQIFRIAWVRAVLLAVSAIACLRGVLLIAELPLKTLGG
jgi:hypothetical protein